MTRVRVLPDDLVNRIAAGEVVERPASVVKELVENSLDAGASRIKVDLRQGGRSLVRVSDDGCGMDGDDALLALERHATSKLWSIDDLDTITTLGFRGEALPSIAAVSRFALHSCADPEQGGVKITVEGGRILAVNPAARARGTTVEVRELFCNLPARRKFLHAPSTELRHAQEMLWSEALARPEVGFELRHGDRTLFHLAPVADAATRIKDLVSNRADSQIFQFMTQAGGIEVAGLIATGKGSARPDLYLFVNGRPVRDRLLVAAILRTLRERGVTMGGAKVMIAITMAHDAVDVNVHPAKAEVRFAHAGTVFAVVQRALAQGMTELQGEAVAVGLAEPGPPDDQVAEPPGPIYGSASGSPAGPSQRLFEHPVYQPSEHPQHPEVAESGARGLGAGPVGAEEGQSGPRVGPSDTPIGRLIGQYRGSFLLVEDQWGLTIVDQHVAHERVLYERVRRQLAGERPPSQSLLLPLLVDVGEALAGALKRVQEVLDRVGICAELFGPDTVRITALPLDVAPEPAQEILVDMLERATALDGVPEQVADKLEQELAAALSCRAAIKVNHPLTEQEQRVLLRDLAASDNPFRCPHGRPIVLRLSQEEMERRLGRR